MKRLLLVPGLVIVLALIAVKATPTYAQTPDQVITLNDTTPGIDVVINLPPATAGAVAVGLNHASVTLSDDKGKILFYMADPRAHAVELALMADSGTHTLTLARLPGVAEAYVSLKPQPSLTERSLASLVPSGALTLDQQQQMLLDAKAPGSTTPITIPPNQLGAITAAFPQSPLTAQLTDGGGGAVATLYGGTLDAVSVTMESGSYLMTLLNSDASRPAIANLSVATATNDNLATLTIVSNAPAATPAPQLVSDSGAESPDNVEAAPSGDCILTVAPKSVNLRSGPGTGYSVLGYSYNGDQHLVGGTNLDGSWVVVSDDHAGSAWMLGQLGELSGDCNNLATYDIPFRAAPAPQVIYATPQVITLPPEVLQVSDSGGGGGSDDGDSYSSGGGSSYDDDHEDDHGGEHESEHEGEDD